MKKRTVLLITLAAVLLGILLAFMNDTTTQAQDCPGISCTPPPTPTPFSPYVEWEWEDDLPLGQLLDCRRSVWPYTCGLLCGKAYNETGEITAMSCMAYKFADVVP